jgi:hypothetical protein
LEFPGTNCAPADRRRGDDQVGMAVDSQLQNLVVLWIAETAISSAMGDQLGSRQHFAQPFPIAEGSAARAAADPR